MFDAHAAFVWRVLVRHGVNARDLEDACQEVFLVVHTRLGEFEQRSTLRTWIYGIAVRVALSFRRKAGRKREDLSAAPPELALEAPQLEDTLSREQLTLIERALGALSADKREVFALYELEGMTMAEVASTLGIPENTALYRLYAARDEIRSALLRHERGTNAALSRAQRRTAV